MERVLIIGLGISGIGSFKLLKDKVSVSVYDAKTEDKIAEEDKALFAEAGIKTFFGCEPEGEYDTLVLSPAVPLNNPIVVKYKDLGAEIIGELELAYRYCKAQFIGITGTNGKTTTTTLVGEIIKAAEMPCEVVGNIGNAVSECCETVTEDTKMVTELSSFQLETIRDFHPHISAMLNLTPDHLDRHGTFESYIAAKMRITENQTKDDYFIYNHADLKTREAADNINNVTKVPFSASEACESLALLENSAFVREGKIVVKMAGKEYELCNATDLQIPGKHNLENALAAAAIGIFAGVKARTVGKVLKAFKGVEHRLELVRELKGVKYINDSKGTNPDAAIKALEAIPAPIILIAGGYDKKLPFDTFIDAFNGKVAYLILLGATAEAIAKTALEKGFPDDRIIKCNSLSACVASASRLAEPGDSVLLSPACASWDMFQSYEHRGWDFKKYVKSL